jgi:hypothetical protein
MRESAAGVVCGRAVVGSLRGSGGRRGLRDEVVEDEAASVAKARRGEIPKVLLVGLMFIARKAPRKSISESERVVISIFQAVSMLELTSHSSLGGGSHDEV